MQGFKTFAHKTTLEFLAPRAGKRGIAAIVGPNGSGKSNCSESVRWALGEQSMKLLRGKKSEDMIFSGTEKKSRAGFAEVTLTLNNEDRQAPIDYTTLAITRRLYRDGNSEYLINGNTVRLADIQLLLAQAQFGQRTYSVIGQGMVDHVLVASPQERKEFFDEAAGVKQFQLKRDQAVNKLEATRENLAQAASLLHEIEPRLRSLSRQVRRLEERGPIEEEMMSLGRAYYGKLWRELLGAMVDAGEKARSIEARRAKKVAALDVLRSERSNFETEATKDAGFLELQKAYEALIEEQNRAREKLLATQNKLAMSAIAGKGALPTSRIVSGLESIIAAQKNLFDRLKHAHTIEDLGPLQYEFSLLLEKTEILFTDLTRPTSQTEADPRTIAEKEEVEKTLKEITVKLGELKERIKNYSTSEREKKEQLFALQRKLEVEQNGLYEIDRELQTVKIELAKLETRRDGLSVEIKTQLSADPVKILEGTLPTLPLPPEEALERFRKLKTQLEVIGSIDPEIVKEHAETKERHDFLKTQIDDLSKAVEDLATAIEELDRIIEERAEVAFKILNHEFGKYFKILFGGGSASLTKTEPAEDEEEVPEGFSTSAGGGGRGGGLKRKEYTGIEIQASPPGKRVKSINMLSGGERALTSIALICAIMAQNPSPFIVLDEVDAALDESNSIRFADIVDDLSSKTQFIIITHNRATMEKANVLYGVTMGDDGISKLLSVKLDEVERIRTSNAQTVSV